MSTLKCVTCGRYTNTTVCDYLDYEDWKPRRCYARYREDNSMEKGCAYDETPNYLRRFVDEECIGGGVANENE